MRKPSINFVIDSSAFLAFIFLISTGTLIYWVLPAGSGNLSIWGLTRHDWGEVHMWIAVSFLSLIAAHVVLHWKWIVNMVRGKSKNQKVTKTRLLFGIVILTIALSIAIAPFFSPVDDSGKSGGKSHVSVDLIRK